MKLIKSSIFHLTMYVCKVEPLLNASSVLLTNDILCPSNSKIYEKKSQYSETLWLQTYFASPWALLYFEAPLHVFSNNKAGIWAQKLTWIIRTQEYNYCVIQILALCAGFNGGNLVAHHHFSLLPTHISKIMILP